MGTVEEGSIFFGPGQNRRVQFTSAGQTPSLPAPCLSHEHQPAARFCGGGEAARRVFPQEEEGGGGQGVQRRESATGGRRHGRAAARPHTLPPDPRAAHACWRRRPFVHHNCTPPQPGRRCQLPLKYHEEIESRLAPRVVPRRQGCLGGIPAACLGAHDTNTKGRDRRGLAGPSCFRQVEAAAERAAEHGASPIPGSSSQPRARRQQEPTARFTTHLLLPTIAAHRIP